MNKIIAFLLVITSLLTGCNEQLTKNGEIAKSHLEAVSYEVLDYEEEASIKFPKSQLTDKPGIDIWGVQKVKPDKYLNEEIGTVSFTVRNHPLDEHSEDEKTDVTVYLYNQEVIGGWSLPHPKENAVGEVYSLDGKTIEEIQGNVAEWKENWINNYQE